MRLRSWVGIAVGGIADVAASILVYFILAIVVAVQLPPSSRSSDAQGAAVISAMNASRSVSAASWVLAYCATLLGGYVAARISRRDEVLVGALSAWTCLAAGVFVMASGSGTMPTWQLALIFASTPFVSGFGGFLCLLGVRRRAAGRDGTSPTSAATLQ